MNLIKQHNLSAQLPPGLLASLQSAKGFDENAFREVHQSGEQVTSVRFNPGKTFNKQFSIFNTLLEKVQWSSAGYYLPERPSFTSDPFFHAGTYYVQEASSMFLEEAIKQTCGLSKPLRVLDLCAAPGGKSTLIQSVISAESLLVSNEVIKTRVNILTENISKWGAANVVVTNNDPGDFQKLGSFFDLIVVDAPCSGSGLFRKDPEAIAEWGLQNVALCSQRQQRILADILPSLKPGGILIYSTCSYSMDEDEVICDWLLADPDQQLSPLRLQVKDEWGIVETFSEKNNAYGYRFYPDKLKGEGFFIAAFRKEGEAGNEIKTKTRFEPASKKEMDILAPWFRDMNGLAIIKWQDEFIVIPASLLNDIAIIQSALYIKKAGVKAGAIMKQELVPDHEFAMSSLPGVDVPSIHMDDVTALQYLRRNDIQIDSNLKGWALVKFETVSLGWVKILPNRINNYYPKSWRILNK